MAVPPPRVSITAPDLPLDRPILTTSPSPSPPREFPATENGYYTTPCGNGPRWKPRSELDNARAKMGKDKAGGWGSIPVNILHHILSYAQDTIGLDDVLQSLCGQKPRTSEIAFTLIRRMWLCSLRLVCSSWRSAVDSHPFWPEYTLIIEPSRHHSSTISDINSARLTPSTPSFPTLFHRARNSTLTTCLACRLNHPSRLGLYPAVRKRLTYTSKFGLTPTCEKHANSFCSNCMRESEPQANRTPSGSYASNVIPASTPSPREHASTLVLSMANEGDVDEHRQSRAPRALVCSDCRKWAISNEILQVLRECARDGQLRGEHTPWLWNERVKDYVEFNVGTAPEMGYAAVEDQWLMDHTRWDELFETALQLQNHEKMLKLQYMRTAEEETQGQRIVRLAKQAELMGEDADGKETEEEAIELEALYRSWWKELEDDDDLDSDDEEEDEILNEKYRAKLRIGCLNDYINDRIRYAFWVMPSDEVKKLVFDEQIDQIDHPEPLHTSFANIATNSIHPFQSYVPFTYSPKLAYKEATGIISLVPFTPAPGVNSRLDPFLPPERLLQAMDSTFSEVLVRRTLPAMESLVKSIRARCNGDDDSAESICEIMQVGNILNRLMAWELWVPKPLVEAKQLAEMQKELETESAYELFAAEEGLEVERGFEGLPQMELVEESETQSDMCFAAAEVASSDTVPQTSSPYVSSALGKRKPSSKEQSPISTDKRARSSVSSEPKTPADQLSPQCRSSTRNIDPSLGTKRKDPPSPVARHINTSQKRVTPPPVPDFTVHDDHKRTRIGPLATAEDRTSIMGSSAPGSPTPVKKVVDFTKLKVPNSHVKTSPGSSDEDPYVGVAFKGEEETGTDATLTLNSADEEVPSSQFTEGHARERLTPVITDDASIPSISPSTTAESALSLSAEDPPSLVTIANRHLIKYMSRVEMGVPFIPLASMQTTMTADRQVNSDDGGSEITISLNLGQGSNQILLQAWYEAREELRECKCGICERARKKAWEGLQAMQQLVASGELEWETLLT
ncbi:uncharacterized protein L203_106023 [Cryptococcus depauperatus CBS 7841]|uniref:F-box domain-containing protein n=1 Tax=Cryptococcus depauperatus CBS 7841 TaxID=1295531 RepID=A0AAJ8M3R1_9TREE